MGRLKTSLEHVWQGEIEIIKQYKFQQVLTEFNAFE